MNDYSFVLIKDAANAFYYVHAGYAKLISNKRYEILNSLLDNDPIIASYKGTENFAFLIFNIENTLRSIDMKNALNKFKDRVNKS